MVQGLDKLKAKLKRSGQTLLRAAGPAMEDGAERVLSTARLLVPKDSGHLAKTLRRTAARPTKNGKGVVVQIMAGDDTTVRGPVQIAKTIEFGNVKTPAQPYMQPAMRLNRKPVRRAINAAIRAAIRRS